MSQNMGKVQYSCDCERGPMTRREGAAGGERSTMLCISAVHGYRPVAGGMAHRMARMAAGGSY
jgi:hypothetical protein